MSLSIDIKLPEKILLKDLKSTLESLKLSNLVEKLPEQHSSSLSLTVSEKEFKILNESHLLGTDFKELMTIQKKGVQTNNIKVSTEVQLKKSNNFICC